MAPTLPLPAALRRWRRSRGPLPGLLPALSLVWLGLGALVVLPLGALVIRAASVEPSRTWELISEPRTVSAFALSFGASAVATLLAAPLGLTVGWVLARYEFVGRSALDALVDVPFALPTAVSGIALATLTAPQGWIGELVGHLGVRVAFTPLGITVALLFVSLPFVVRSVQAVAEALPRDVDEAAATLGASRAVAFWRVSWPALRPALATGCALAFARALGEYGSVVFIAGNLPGETEILPVRIVAQLEQYQYDAAALVAVAMLAASLAVLALLLLLQRSVRVHVRRP